MSKEKEKKKMSDLATEQNQPRKIENEKKNSVDHSSKSLKQEVNYQ